MTLGDLDPLRLRAGDALVLDFDGTLAEIGPDPDAVQLDAATAPALLRLADRLDGAVAILSGRDLRDLAARVPDGLWRLGGHGLEIAAPGEAPSPAAARPAAATLAALTPLARHPGVRIEIKGPVIALHYRAAPLAGPACREAADTAARTAPGLVAQAGKMVVEVKPHDAHKGTALRRLFDRPPFAGRRPLMLGDDVTDEDAMRAAADLGGLGVKVGRGASVARLRAPSPRAVRAWLAREAADGEVVPAAGLEPARP